MRIDIGRKLRVVRGIFNDQMRDSLVRVYAIPRTLPHMCHHWSCTTRLHFSPHTATLREGKKRKRTRRNDPRVPDKEKMRNKGRRLIASINSTRDPATIPCNKRAMRRKNSM
jgi:hypothetical protein